MNILKPGFVPTLETERLWLRGHRPDDFEASAAMWADPRVVAYISGVPSSREASWNRLLRYAGHWALLGYGYWVVEAKSDGRFIGEVGFADFKRDLDPPIPGIPEAGWALNSAEFGQGFGTEAVRRIHQWADGRAGFETTFCLFDPEHRASLRVASKVGYAQPEMADFDGNTALLLWRRPQDGAASSPVEVCR